MNKDERKAALARYREDVKPVGIYALRCQADGAVWVGQARDLRAIENRVFFTLRQGSNPHRALQEAWKVYGAEAFGFEVLEELDPEELGLGLERTLKERHALWMETLGARRI